MLKTVQAISGSLEIPYPAVESEFEVQAWLWAELRKAGFDAKGEVQILGKFGLRKTKASCRFDVVVFDVTKKAICVFEVKARVVRHKTVVEDTRQGRRYPHFGVPVHFVYGMAGAEAALKMVQATL